MKLNIVMVEPEIPQNTGNIARTCAAIGAKLHLVHPLGFKIDEKSLKRAGLDYWDKVKITYHPNLPAFLETIPENGELYIVSKFASKAYTEADYTNTEKEHYFLFGKETTGLPEMFMRQNPEKCIRIPQNDEHIRALNLSNTAAIVVYEALRQQGFPNLETTHTYENDKLK